MALLANAGRDRFVAMRALLNKLLALLRGKRT